MTREAHAAAVAMAKAHGMVLYELTSRAVLGLEKMTPAGQRSFLNGDNFDAVLPSGERAVPLTKLCNMIQHDAIGLDALIDDVMEDGRVDPCERAKVRGFIKQMLEKLCHASAYVAEPAGV